jgi:hypothetical protein
VSADIPSDLAASDLAAGHRFYATANGLRHVGTGHYREAQNRSSNDAARYLDAEGDWDSEGEENERDQRWQASEQLDVADGESPDTE